MNDPLFVRCLEGHGNLACDRKRFIQWYRSAQIRSAKVSPSTSSSTSAGTPSNSSMP